MSGAGMSVDSGLADFRSLNGIFDRLKKREKHMEYYDIMNHKYFEGHPERFWYLYGERYNAYKAATPHNGYNILKQWGEVLKKGKYFSYTSNVDGHFIKAGFPENKLVE
jgi:NAD-dependent SIR2 family protein deacetylase